ncbi:MAG TPA: HAD-IA family hydrolase [Candidatus Paceibacterota bacterium]|nr:HAD-IA family hydrolase [Candidatus Paceibacterota bacterium]
MPKVVLLDADGVVLKKTDGYFSDRFAEEYGAPKEDVLEFFRGPFKLCQTGKADLKEELKDRLPAWGWSKSVEEFLEYWFEEARLDDDVVAVAQTFREKGVKCYLATDQEKYRKEYIWKKLEGKLDGSFISSDIGFTKSQPEFFAAVLQQLGVESSDVTYFDDDQHNVDTAKSLGIDAHFYTSIGDLKKY